MILYTYSNADRAAFLLTLRTSWIKLKSHLSNSKRKTTRRLRWGSVLSIHWDRCGLLWQRRRCSELTPLTQQITPVLSLFYDAPARPVGVFDDFLAIQPAQGNVSTLSYYDYSLSGNSLDPASSKPRFVIRKSVGGNDTDTISNPQRFL